MKIGISTSSLFLRADNDVAMSLFKEWDLPVCEVFLSTYSEYDKDFATLLKKNNDGVTEVHSMHTLNMNYEPQLYNRHPKVQKDAFGMMEKALEAGEVLGAKYYTFHGVARVKKTPLNVDFAKVGADTQRIVERCKAHGIALAYENVHWAYYNAPGFFKEVRARVPELKGTLDIKQARQSGYGYKEYLDEMGKDLVTVHLSDVDGNGKIRLPGQGGFDFYRLFSELKEQDFDGACLIEVYQDSFRDYDELLRSLEFLRETASKVR